MANSSSSSSGIGFTGLLTVLFIGLKLCKVISWSWIWVISPVWIAITIIILGFLLVISLPLLFEKINKRSIRNRQKKAANLKSSKNKNFNRSDRMLEMLDDHKNIKH